MARNGANAAAASGLIALVVSALFLAGSPNVFPIDDAYLHLAYAEHLASGRGLIFHDPGETGLGATSALWVALLALGQGLGLSTRIAARAAGRTAPADICRVVAGLLADVLLGRGVPAGAAGGRGGGKSGVDAGRGLAGIRRGCVVGCTRRAWAVAFAAAARRDAGG